MLTKSEAKKIGIKACIDKIGYDFCKLHEDNGVSLYGLGDNGLYDCFVGISDQPASQKDISEVDELVLSPGNDWPYYARCDVNMEDGSVEFIEYKTSTNEVLEHHEQA